MLEIVIDTEENDDWMKTLPGYKDEREIISSLTFDDVVRPAVVAKKSFILHVN